jgi:hypothetical protein
MEDLEARHKLEAPQVDDVDARHYLVRGPHILLGRTTRRSIHGERSAIHFSMSVITISFSGS